MPVLSNSQNNTSYRRLADVYDHLMGDAPYDRWMQVAVEVWRHAGTGPSRVAELGCGTGSLTRYLLEYGFEVWGVDLSADMLHVAREKVERSHPDASVHWLCQDIRELALSAHIDSVLCFCDTLNYISDAEGVQRVFARVYEALVPGGTFLFDVHTPYKIAEVFGNESFSHQDGEVAYIWESTYDPDTEAVEHDLTLFVQEQDGLYRRFHELHHQQTYHLADLTDWLAAAGFELLSITADFTGQPVEEDSERAFFAVRKPVRED
ncbi:methyltransferase family protein [Aneurinibacillus soli]|uniref:dTDP-3-amino-3,4, 6-trideoxy-alpha-D-glucopyranose n=1 Tax=Aneurinibacillus soli TaxID=1500254 RepID=A0A0U5B8R7_9BACL|nr:methyltransferase family protein [Aneurinibacillus soli]BAU27149.1 dTDP-3-amino-3,4, 6-trideoxy-alpha-D-glucopyranose [Aneurinibacillus soli]